MAKNKADVLAEAVDLVENIEDMIETLEDIVEEVKADVSADAVDLAVDTQQVESQDELGTESSNDGVNEELNSNVLPILMEPNIVEGGPSGESIDEVITELNSTIVLPLVIDATLNEEKQEPKQEEPLVTVYIKEPRCTCYGPVIHIQNMSGRYDQCTICGLKK